MRQIGVGIVGAGSIAEIGHCPSIAALPNAKLAVRHEYRDTGINGKEVGT